MTPAQDGSRAERARRVREVLSECQRRRGAGENLSDDQVCDTHPELLPELADELRKLAVIRRARVQAGPTNTTPAPPPLADDQATIDSRRPDLTTTSPGPKSGTADGAWLTLNAESASLLPGYEIVREIHRGGQGIVYQALQKSTRRKVAIKVLLGGALASPSDRMRFDREVQILGTLKHPNIVTIHDSGVAGECFYYVMDYIAGQPLDEYIAARKPSIPDALALFRKICDAVNAAHLRGIIHRDLKPSNIRVDADGEPHVLDFGLAKTVSGSGQVDVEMMTMTGQFLGSLPWASPEQAEGNPDSLDLRTDVYSLGVILYQMLTGKFPYEVVGNMRDVLNNIVNAAPARPSTVRRQINNEVETIVLRCLSKDRDRRYQTAGDLARDVARYLSGEPIEAKRDSLWYVLKKRARRNPWQSVGMAAVAVIAVSWGFVALRAYGIAEDARRKQANDSADIVKRMGEMEALASATREAVRRLAINQFLLENRAGRSTLAKRLMDRMPADWPEHRIMAAVLDESITPEALLATMPESHQWMAWWAIGERNEMANRAAPALDAYQRARRLVEMDHPGPSERLDALDARIEQMRGRLASAVDAGGGTGGAP